MNWFKTLEKNIQLKSRKWRLWRAIDNLSIPSSASGDTNFVSTSEGDILYSSIQVNWIHLNSLLWTLWWTLFSRLIRNSWLSDTKAQFIFERIQRVLKGYKCPEIRKVKNLDLWIRIILNRISRFGIRSLLMACILQLATQFYFLKMFSIK